MPTLSSGTDYVYSQPVPENFTVNLIEKLKKITNKQQKQKNNWNDKETVTTEVYDVNNKVELDVTFEKQREGKFNIKFDSANAKQVFNVNITSPLSNIEVGTSVATDAYIRTITNCDRIMATSQTVCEK